MKKALCSLAVLGLLAVVACGGERDPSEGTYTISFPSTSAAVATDFVQLYVFDVTAQNRASICQEVVTTRTTAGTLSPSATAAPANICEMRLGRKPITFAYGEKAILAVAQRKDAQGSLQDFLIGCAVMTIGDGDAPLPIPVHLVSAGTPVPATTCGSVGEYCDGRCS